MVEQSRRSQMHLGLFAQPHGYHVGGWRHPEADGRSMDLDWLVEVARTAEEGLLDFFFLADGLSFDDPSRASTIARHEPTTLLGALSPATSRIGLAATISTSFTHPYTTARTLSSLDHLSSGRAAWNVVTSATHSAARSYGQQQLPEHAERYARAAEHVQATRQLWDAWEEGALRQDPETGVFVNPEKVHPVEFIGEHIATEGALTIPRSPQGHPVVIQAGSSPDGQRLAAAEADVVFTTQPDVASARDFSRGLRRQIAEAGRDPEEVRILTGVNLLVDSTQQEAEADQRTLDSFGDLASGLRQIQDRFGTDLSTYDLDSPFPQLELGELGQSRNQIILRKAAEQGLSIRQVALMLAASRGHHQIAAEAHSAADELEEWFTDGEVDGFIITLPFMSKPLRHLVDLLIPELQCRGLFRTEYTGTTLREHLGLQRPPVGAGTRIR